jgi:DNA polymerase-3 subunit delta
MIYLFYGDDQFTLSEEINKLKKETLPPEAEDFNFARLDALKNTFTIDDLLQAAEAYPFLSDKRLVIVTGLLGRLGKSALAEERAAARAATRPARGRAAAPSKPTTPRERFLDFIPNQMPSTILVIVEEKIDKRDAVFKAVEKLGAVREFLPLENWALEKWINDRAVKLEITLDRAVAPLLREFVGNNLYSLTNELKKLGAYAGEGETVTTQMVELLTAEVQDSKIWDLTDALARRDYRQAMVQLARQRNESTLSRAGFTRKTFAIICNQMYDLLRISELYNSRKTKNEIAQSLGMNPYRVEKTIPMLRNFQPGRLEKIYARLTEADYADKSGKADLNIQLDLLVANICLEK